MNKSTDKDERESLDLDAVHLWTYALQSFFAVLAVFATFLILTVKDVIITASVGSTAFLVFAMPRARSARARNVIGGQLTGLLTGALLGLLPNHAFPLSILIPSAAVGLSIFLMLIFKVEHPPASGTALGVSLTGFHPDSAIALIFCSVVLALIHATSSERLKTLVRGQ